MTTAAPRVTPDLLKSDLASLGDEIEARSEALPPDDGTLDGWQGRLDALWDQVKVLRRDARNRLWAVVEQTAKRIESLRKASAAFRTYPPAIDNGDAAIVGTIRSALSAAIGDIFAPSTPIFPPLGDVSPHEAEPRRATPKPNTAQRVAIETKPVGEQREKPVVVSEPVAGVDVRKATTAPPPAVPQVEPLFSTPAVPGFWNTIKRARQPANSPRPRQFMHAPAAKSWRTDPVVAYVGRLAQAGTFDKARSLACNWLRSRRFALPDDLSNDLECHGPGQDKVVVVRHEGIWAMQADVFQPAANRRWRTEMVLVDDPASTPALSLVLRVTGPARSEAPAPTIPRLAEGIIDQIGLIDLQDGTALSTLPTLVETEAEVEALVQRLRSTERLHPIIVQSQYLKDATPKTLLDPASLSVKLRGLAHVVTLGREQFASWALTDRLSKRFSVFGASLRLYRPGFTTEDDPERHPLWTPTSLRQRGVDLRGLQEEMLREAAISSLAVLDNEDMVPAFDDVQKSVLKRRIERAKTQRQTTVDAASLTEHIAGLKAELDETNALAKVFADENEELRHELARTGAVSDDASARVIYLQDRVRMLEQRNLAAAGSPVELPTTWNDLEDWAAEHLGKRVVITPKAARAARRSSFEDIQFAYDVLLFLADTYVPCRRGELNNGKIALEREQARLGVEISGVGNAVDTHRWRDTYSVPYKSRQVSLDMHVSGKSSRDPRYGFRLYFHWDDEDKCVVVGSFPSHLDNSLS